MRLCVNHPENASIEVCHNCGNSFCKEIEKGVEKYFCKNTECQKALYKELSSALPLHLECPNCKDLLDLTPDERIRRIITCPACDILIDYNYNPPKVAANENLDNSRYELNVVENPRILDLFFSPRTFFNKTIKKGQKPYLVFITFLMGISTSMDSVDEKNIYIFGSTWTEFWLICSAIALFSGVMIWFFGGWWYKKRLQFAGAVTPDKYKARYVYIYSHFVYAAPLLLLLIVYTIVYKNFPEAIIRDRYLYLIPVIFLFVSLYTSYTGAVEVFKNLSKWRARVWFIVLPALFI
jgi:hypothetical protein